MSHVAASCYSPDQIAAFSLRTSWKIAPDGDDTNEGGADAPLKTHRELMRRIGRRVGGYVSTPGKVLVDVVALDPIDPLRVELEVGPDTLVHYQGHQTKLYGGNMGAVTPYAGNVQWAFADPHLLGTWGDYLSQHAMIVVTTGPRAGTTGWPLKDLGGPLRVSHPFQSGPIAYPFAPWSPPFSFSWPGLVEGDAYALVRLTSASALSVDLSALCSFDGNNFRSLIFENFAFGPNGVWNVRSTGNTRVAFVNCDVGNLNPAGCALETMGCRMSSIQPFPGIYLVTGGAVLDNFLTAEFAGQIELANVVVQGIDCQANGGAILLNGDLGVFDHQGVSVEFGGEVHTGIHALYGSGNSHGINVTAGRLSYRDGHKPSIEGPWRVSGDDRSPADVPFFDAGTGSGIVLDKP